MVPQVRRLNLGLVLLTTHYSLPTSSQNVSTAHSNDIKKVLDKTYIHLLLLSVFSSQSTARSPHPHANFSLSFLLSAPSALKTTPPHTTHPTAEHTVSPNSPQLRSTNAKIQKRQSIQTQHFQTITNAYSRNSCIFIPLQTGGGCFSSRPTKRFDRASAHTHEAPQTYSFHALTSHFSVYPEGRRVDPGGYPYPTPLSEAAGPRFVARTWVSLYSLLTIHYPLLLATYSKLSAETKNDRGARRSAQPPRHPGAEPASYRPVRIWARLADRTRWDRRSSQN
jgi:hypothetical protein